jgi:hypothetical protein
MKYNEISSAQSILNVNDPPWPTDCLTFGKELKGDFPAFAYTRASTIPGSLTE